MAGAQGSSSELQIQLLIQQLAETESALQRVITGQVDAVVDPTTATPFLLRHAQTVLRQSEARYRRLLARMSALVFELAPDGTIEYVNNALTSVTGYWLDEIEGRSWPDLFLRGSQRQQWDWLMQQWQRGDVANSELLITAKDGRSITLELTTANRYTPEGTLEQILGCAIDITERQLATRRIEQLTQHYKLILSAVGDGILGVDQHGLLRFVNPAATRLLGWTAEELDGAGVYMLLHHGAAGTSHLRWEESPIAAVLREGVIRSQQDISFRHKGGGGVPVAYVATPLLDDEQVVGAVITFKDISHQKQAEEALRKQIEAQEAVRLRDEFLSIAAHELRTPLTALLGYAQLLQRLTLRQQLLPQREQQLLETLILQAERLNRMILSLLDLSRLQLGQLALEMQPLDVCALIRRIVDEVRLTLERHTLELHCTDDVLMVLGDDLRLEQVFINLVQNAIKYSPAGGPIRIFVEQLAGQLSVRVEDQGIGIPAEALPHLFDRFYRAANAMDGPTYGMGLGLYVVKEIVTLHGGSVSVTSQQGQGTAFHVLLPLAAQASAGGAPGGSAE